MTSALTTDCQQREFQLPITLQTEVKTETASRPSEYLAQSLETKENQSDLFHVFLDCKAIEPKPFW